MPVWTMELHCLLSETPTTTSSSSTDPLYDNCPPYPHRGRDRGWETQLKSTILCPAVTRVPAPCTPLLGQAPAAAEVPTLGGGGRSPGIWPDHSYCSWRGGLGIQGWEAELGPGINKLRGGEPGLEDGCREGVEDSEHKILSRHSPSQSESDEQESVLSLYDNIPEDVTPDSLQGALNMETCFQEHLQEVWDPEQIQDLMEGVSGDNNSWSSCEIILSGSNSSKRCNQDQHPDQEKEFEMEPELDSGSFVFKQSDPILHLQLLMSPPHSHLTTDLLPQYLTEQQDLRLQDETQQLRRTPKIPPPVPLADPSASALRSLLTSLQQQIIRQREEYEAKILSLEQRNEELQEEVSRLRTNLAQHQQWYQAVQTKIVESERARALAELRNAALQREMEQFFDTFGELNNEAKKTEYIVKTF
ncbi:uncharacterized protein LOC117519916 [Thalassophryne amazonica]|uniref:uncharacterized protein LOC117519916 n=1 Tax=Thalassophryne amazonica TaxID=390379 RepID=UPI001471CC4D|nr:uncharacterized protein LOC117519916 [Thalassophryne amazonica]